jgi:hypothetical protein
MENENPTEKLKFPSSICFSHIKNFALNSSNISHLIFAYLTQKN